MLYPEQRGASTAGPAPTIVGRAMWEVKRGALGVGHEKSGLWWRKRLGKGQSQGAKSVKPPPPWNSLLWDGAERSQIARVLIVGRLQLRTNEGGVEQEKGPNRHAAANRASRWRLRAASFSDFDRDWGARLTPNLFILTRLRLTRREPGLAVWSGDQRPALDDSSEPTLPGGKSWGRRTIKWAPRPGDESTSIRPPCAWTIP